MNICIAPDFNRREEILLMHVNASRLVFVLQKCSVFNRCLAQVSARTHIAVALFLSLAFSVFSQNPHFTAYGITSGLERADVSSIFQDSRGTLWVGTQGAGLYEFSQGRFARIISSENTGYRIQQIDEDASGYLYVLSDKGLFRYDGNAVLKIADQRNPISCFAITQTGIWWATKDSVSVRRTSGTYGTYPFAEGLLIGSCQDDCELIVATPRALISVDAQFNQIRSAVISDTKSVKWVSYSIDDAGTIHLISADGTMLSFDGKSYAITATHLSNVTDIANGALGGIWIAGASGISVFQSLDSSIVALNSGSPAACLYFDNENRLWVGSSTEGLLRYFGEQYRAWSIHDARTFSGFAHGGTAETTLVFDKSGRMTTLAHPDELIAIPINSQEVTNIYTDKLERTWVTGDSVLWMRRDTGWMQMDTGAIYNTMHIVGSDHLSNLWMEDKSSIWHFGIMPRTSPLGIAFGKRLVDGPVPDDRPIAVLTDKDGGTYRIGLRSVGQILNNHYEQTHRLGFEALSADIDAAGVLWFGTQASGIFRMKPGHGTTPEPLITSYPIRSTDIVFILRLEESIIAGTERSILRLHTDSTSLHVSKVEVLNASTGPLPSRLTADDYCVTADGRLLVRADDRVLEFEIAGNDVVDDLPTVGIAQISINGEDMYKTVYASSLGPFGVQRDIPVLLSAENSIAFVFSGHTAEDEHLYYQWKLNGLSDDWSEPSLINRAQFAHLKPGNYTLEVHVCDESGNCGALSKAWRFEIQMAWWQPLWFRIGAGLLTLVVIWFMVRYLTRSRKKEQEREKARLVAELNALTLEQKSLQLQMNPHFIFNALQTVRSRINEDHLDDARDNLTRFAKLMRMTLEMSRSEKISLEEELDFLQLYVDVEKMSRSLPLRFQFHVAEDIALHEYEIPPMLIQPVLENALKYGGNETEIVVDIDVQLKGEYLIITVEDNGTGFGRETTGHKSASLDIIRDRLARIGKGGSIILDPRVGDGARVVLKIPI